jgi:hypothetical protein
LSGVAPEGLNDRVEHLEAHSHEPSACCSWTGTYLPRSRTGSRWVSGPADSARSRRQFRPTIPFSSRTSEIPVSNRPSSARWPPVHGTGLRSASNLASWGVGVRRRLRIIALERADEGVPRLIGHPSGRSSLRCPRPSPEVRRRLLQFGCSERPGHRHRLGRKSPGAARPMGGGVATVAEVRPRIPRPWLPASDRSRLGRATFQHRIRTAKQRGCLPVSSAARLDRRVP